jgi:hypothetical protein
VESERKSEREVREEGIRNDKAVVGLERFER